MSLFGIKMELPKVVREVKAFRAKVEKIDKILIFVLLFAFLFRITFLFYSRFRGWDETVYLNLGRDLSQHPLFYSLKNAGWNDFIPSADPIYGWPNIGFRAPLLPYIIALFYALHFDFLIPFIMPVVATASVYLVYVLGKKLFDTQVGLYSSILFALTPLHVLYSGKIWTDPLVVFFILLTFISFWKGYEEGNKKYKVLFGLFLALSLLARYTTLWIAPIFLIYFLIRDKSLKFLKDRYLWYSISVFFLTLVPWFMYGLNFYGNIFGPFIHGYSAANYWGGVQSWNFFFIHLWYIFSVLEIVFVLSLVYVLFKKEFIKKEMYLILIWIVFFSALLMHMPHKEERFILPIIPALCLIGGFSISKIKKYKKSILGLICVCLMFSLEGMLKTEYQEAHAETNTCFSAGNTFLADLSIDKNAIVITNQLPIVHYYTQKEVRLYPDPWNLETLQKDINEKYKNRNVYIFFSNYDMKDMAIKNDLDSHFKKVFECSKGDGYSAVYKY